MHQLRSNQERETTYLYWRNLIQGISYTSHEIAEHQRGASLVAQTVKDPPAMRETWVRPLGWEDPLKKIGNPLQCSCLENSMDRGAWWVTVHGVAESDRTE